jgi:putative ABC transport system permease protein
VILAKFGLRNFWLQRQRNLFALTAIAVGVTGLIGIGGYIDRWEHTLRTDSIYLRGQGMVSIYRKNGWLMNRSQPKKFTLTRADQEQIYAIVQKLPGVERVGSVLNGSGLISNGCQSQPFEIRGYDLDVDQWMRERPIVRQWCGKLLQFVRGRSFALTSPGPLVGIATGLASLIGKSAVKTPSTHTEPLTSLSEYCRGPGAAQRIAEDPNVQLMAMTASGHFNAADADIAHVFRTGSKVNEDTQLTAPLSLVQDLLQTDRVSSIAIYLEDYRRSDQVAQLLRQSLAQARLDYDVHVWNERKLSPIYTGLMNFLHAMALFCALLIGSVVVLAVVNLTTMNVLQRSRELGTLKALGYGSGALLQIFCVEAAALGVLGCLVGTVMAKALAVGISHAGIQFTPPGSSVAQDFLVAPDMATIAMVVAFVLSLVLASATGTAWSLGRRSCLDLLTHNA